MIIYDNLMILYFSILFMPWLSGATSSDHVARCPSHQDPVPSPKPWQKLNLCQTARHLNCSRHFEALKTVLKSFKSSNPRLTELQEVEVHFPTPNTENSGCLKDGAGHSRLQASESWYESYTTNATTDRRIEGCATDAQRMLYGCSTAKNGSTVWTWLDSLS